MPSQLADFIQLQNADLATFAEWTIEARHSLALQAKRDIARATALFTDETDIVIWEREILDLAISECAEFCGTIFRAEQRPIADQLWFFKKFGLTYQFRGESYDCPAAVVANHDEGAIMIPVPITGFGEDFSEDEFKQVTIQLSLSKPVTKDGATFLALLEFMKLTLASVENVRFPRAARRRITRQNTDPGAINFVSLRRRSITHEQHTLSGREYSHQWIVRGHWRRLHEPRKRDGAEVTFIDSYVKGPRGAPLLPQRERIFLVNR